MSLKIADLYALTDEQVIVFHDEASEHTVVGTDYWMQELERRSRVRTEESNTRLATAANRLAIASTGLSVVSVIVAVVALFVR